MALKIKPCEIAAWSNRGIVYRRKGELDKAIADFTDGIKCLPPRLEPVRVSLLPDVLTNQLTQHSAQDVERNRLVLLGAFIHFQRGLAYYDKQEYDKAIGDFTETIRLNPVDASGYIGRGATYSRPGCGIGPSRHCTYSATANRASAWTMIRATQRSLSNPLRLPEVPELSSAQNHGGQPCAQ